MDIINLFNINRFQVNRFLFIFFILSGFSSAFCQFLKNDEIDRLNNSLTDSACLLEENNVNIDVNDILKGTFNNQFIPVKEFTKVPVSNNVYWIKLRLNTKEKSNIGLLIPRANHRVDLYEVTDSAILHQVTGMYVSHKFNQEIIPFSNCLKLTYPGNSEILLRIKNKYDENPSFNLRLVSITDEIRKNNTQNIIDGFIHGLLWLYDHIWMVAFSSA